MCKTDREKEIERKRNRRVRERDRERERKRERERTVFLKLGVATHLFVAKILQCVPLNVITLEQR
jgi:hypothetical protein